MADKIPQKANGIKRMKNAFFYSYAGLKSAFKDEAAFRQELLLFIILTVLLLFLPFDTNIKMILFVTHIVVLITELLNSAIEAIVDLASENYHKLAKKAKDIASSAVLLSLLLAGILWLWAITTILM